MRLRHVYVDDQTHTLFKVFCAHHGRSMKEVAEKLIIDLINKEWPEIYDEIDAMRSGGKDKTNGSLDENEYDHLAAVLHLIHGPSDQADIG